MNLKFQCAPFKTFLRYIILCFRAVRVLFLTGNHESFLSISDLLYETEGVFIYVRRSNLTTQSVECFNDHNENRK